MSPCLVLAAALTLAGDPASDAKSARPPHPFAPSLPQLTDEEEDNLDAIIDRFILQDTGRLTGEEGKKARQEFDRLGPEAIPALIRGLNRSAAIDHSCPAVVIAKKLARMLASSTDTELLDFARENIGAGIRQSRHAAILKDLRVVCIARKGEVVRRGTALPQAPRGLAAMKTSDLANLATRERGPRLQAILGELGRRRDGAVLAALALAAASAAGSSDETNLKSARDALAKHLGGLEPAALRDKLKDEQPEVRGAAARVVGEKKLPYGGQLVELLLDESPYVRETVHGVLVGMNAGEDLGPSRNATEAERNAAVKRWREWWSKRKGS